MGFLRVQDMQIRFGFIVDSTLTIGVNARSSRDGLATCPQDETCLLPATFKDEVVQMVEVSK